MKHKKGTTKVVALCLGAVVCFFLTHRASELAPGAVDRLVSCVVFPFLQMQRYLVVPVAQAYEEWRRKSLVDVSYRALIQERDDLRAELLECKATHTFVQETDELRAFKEQYSTAAAVLVRVLGRQSGTAGNYFLVEGGTTKGIHKDTAVVYKNCLVGKVTEVYPFYSKVVLISDPSCKVAAYCDGTGTQGIYQGTESAEVGALTHVGHLSEVHEGDTVFSSGEGVIFPRGFGIGTISSCAKNEGDMQYTIRVTPLLDFSTVDYCYVLEKSPMEPDSLSA